MEANQPLDDETLELNAMNLRELHKTKREVELALFKRHYAEYINLSASHDLWSNLSIKMFSEKTQAIKAKTKLIEDTLPPRFHNRKTKMTVAYLLTVNPPSHIPQDQFLSAMHKLIKSSDFIYQCKYVFEVRNNKTPSMGVHCHAVFDLSSDKPPSKYFYQCKSKLVTLGIFTTTSLPNSIFNVKYIQSEKDLSKVYDYISGTKKDPTGVKSESISLTAVWRDNHQIKPIYEKL